MTEKTYQHRYHIGDIVLADFGAARVPGVIKDERDGGVLVELAQPWVDAAGKRYETAWLSPERLEAYLGEDTGGGVVGWFTEEGVLPSGGD